MKLANARQQQDWLVQSSNISIHTVCEEASTDIKAIDVHSSAVSLFVKRLYYK